MDYIWIVVAFSCGFLARQINLPPLVGYLAAGFGLHALGVHPDDWLNELSDLGVTLLLFTIGLKLNIKDLLKPEILFGASGHMVAVILVTTLNSLILGYLGFTYFEDLDWRTAMLIGLAVSFSSTVCAVKILEDRGEMASRHGQVAIGILIIQDIVAVAFVSVASDASPSWLAFGLLLLPLAKPLASKLLQLSGHGELLPLAGIFLAISGGFLFELVNLKAHFGTLVVAVLLSGDKKASELAKSLFTFKDLFLIAFFLEIGFTALPTIEMIGVALIMAFALPLKAALFYLWLTRLRLRSRSAFLAALSLGNYSEFGLIVCAISVSYGLLSQEWLVIMALAVAFSLVLSSIINLSAHNLFGRWRHHLCRFEHPDRLAEDSFSQPTDAEVLVIGMGRVGTGAFDMYKNQLNKTVCGIELGEARVDSHRAQGRDVIRADAEDPEFWAQVDLTGVNLILLSMPNYLDILEVEKQLRLANYKGKTAAIARFEDEKEKLLASGITVVFDFYNEAGAGFADRSVNILDN